jgi:hypothetical protein
MKPDTRSHGFRISAFDGIVLFIGGCLTVWLYREDNPVWWLVATVLGHFFLFCNVFLVWRRWELLWAAIFLVNVTVHLIGGDTNGGSVFAWQLPLTLWIIALQIRSPFYHGVFAQRWNRRLQEYLNDNPKTP